MPVGKKASEMRHTSHRNTKNYLDPTHKRSVHGPRPKRVVYRLAIEKVINSTWCDDWILADDIAYHANKHISPFWTQLSRFSAASILRSYVKLGHLEVESRHNKPNLYKRVKIIETEDYEYKGGNWEGPERCWKGNCKGRSVQRCNIKEHIEAREEENPQ